MKKETYLLLENYMLSCMKDSAHDEEHIHRVLYNALDIAHSEGNVDYNVLICACLLHDIGRKEQFENSNLCHAKVGSKKAYQFLIKNGFTVEFAEHVRSCIETHRFRKGNPPQSIEAKILFDADKIDVSGAIGIARTLVYKGQVLEPLYSLLPNGQVSDGEDDNSPSFFEEYKCKLENIYAHFFTIRGAEIAKSRKKAAVRFYKNMLQEVSESYENGVNELNKYLE